VLPRGHGALAADALVVRSAPSAPSE